MKVDTEWENIDVEGDYGSVDGIRVTCDRCGHSVESGGTGSASFRRCAALLRDECPKGEDNFYIVDD